MKLSYFIIIALSLICGFLIFKILDKRNNNIIKLLIKRDILPLPGNNTKWIQKGICYMGDGSLGKVDGIYCNQIKVL